VGVTCPCGLVMSRGGQIEQTGGTEHASEEEVHHRETVCLFCEHRMGARRCRQIADGCQVTYQIWLRAKQPKCDKWKSGRWEKEN